VPWGAARGTWGVWPEGGLPGGLEGGFGVALFLALPGVPLVGQKNKHFWGVRGCLWVITNVEVLREPGLQLWCPGGPATCPGGGCKGFALSGTSGGPLLGPEKRNICAVCAGAFILPATPKGSKTKFCHWGSPGGRAGRLGCGPREGPPEIKEQGWCPGGMGLVTGVC